MRRVSALLQAGGFQAAHEQLETIVAANPGYVEALRLLAGTKQVLGDAVPPKGCCAGRSRLTRIVSHDDDVGRAAAQQRPRSRG